MVRVVALARRVAASHSPVLITGETGTGKELLARTIHAQSPRALAPLVAINCAAIPETLLESEMFGYRRGAFTGAHADKPGLVPTAAGGTLFLDEIGELPLSLQPKLLRFLEDGTYLPLGALRPVSVDVRVVAATNAPLEERVAAGSFRRDLYYRLSVVPIAIPPLRERPGDIVALAHSFLQQLAREIARPIPGLSEEAVQYLTSRSWPGNARELRNAIERAVIVSDGGLLTLADFLLCDSDTSRAERMTARGFRPRSAALAGRTELLLEPGPASSRSACTAAVWSPASRLARAAP